MTKNENDFFERLASVASSFARAKGNEELDLHCLWLAFLYLAKNEFDDAANAVRTHAPEVDLEMIDFPKMESVQVLPFPRELKPVFGPLGAFVKSEARACTADNFIPIIQSVLKATHFSAKDTVPENFPRTALTPTNMDETRPPKPSIATSQPNYSPVTPTAAKATQPLALATADLHNRLKKEVFGQGPTIDLFVESIGRAMARPKQPSRLRWSSLLFGPHGCGKSQVLSVLKKWLEDHRAALPIKQFIQIEGYLPGTFHSLRNQLRDRGEPGILVVSEIEKFNNELSNVLLEGLSSAELQLPQSNYGDQLYRTSIEGWIVLLTGNVGKRFWSRLPFREKETLPTLDQIRETLEHESIPNGHVHQKVLNRAFLDRIETFLPFGQLRYADMMQVIDREVDNLSYEMKSKGIKLEVESFVKELVTFQASYKRAGSGRRGLVAFKQHIESPVRRLEVEGFQGSILIECADAKFRGGMNNTSPRLMVVDDEAPSVVEKLKEVIGQRASVVGVLSIEQAVHEASKEKYDLMFLDMYFSGSPLWREYLSAWRLAYPEIPVVLFSSRVPSGNERLEIDQLGGVIGFVSKERTQVLLEHIQPVLEHVHWQARVREFQTAYGYGGDQIMFDCVVESREGGKALIRFDRIECVASEGRQSNTADVVLTPETQQEIDEFVKLFLDVEGRQRLGLKRPRGLLFYGPPGNGKTLIARNLANKIRCNFMAVAVSDIRSMYAGVASEKLREIFDAAQLRQPCVLFIDEIDGVFPVRSQSASGGGVERDDNATVGAFLAMLDGFENDSEVFVIGATNRKDSIDPALLRPGRLDRHIEIGKPRLAERKKILESWSRRNKKARFDIDWAARETYDLSGADVMRVADDSTLVAFRSESLGLDSKDISVTDAHFREAVDRFRFGALPSNGVNRTEASEKLRARVAWHEAGHLVAQYALLGAIPDRLTIVARGDFGGYVRTSEEDSAQRFSSLSLTRSSAINEIACLLAGGIAEQLQFKEHCAGVSDDRRRAWALAWRMVTEWGMGSLEAEAEMHGTIKNSPPGGAGTKDVTEILEEAQKIARAKLEENAVSLGRIVAAALEYEDLNSEKIRELLGVTSNASSS